MANALSRRKLEEPHLAVLSTPTFHLYDELCAELQKDTDLRMLRDSIVADRGESWWVHEGLILLSSRVFVPSTPRALPTVLQLTHTEGHEGIQKTLQRLRRDFFVDQDHQVVRKFVGACATCQQNKTKTLHLAGLLQPLVMPSRV